MRRSLYTVFVIAVVVFAVTGCSETNDSVNVSEIPPAGVSSWVKTYGKDTATALQDGMLTPDGGYLLVGSNHYSHNNTNFEDLVILKADQDGEVMWEKTMGGDRFDRANRIIATPDGNGLILGETRSFGAGDRDLYLVKLDLQGNALWSQTFGGEGEEMAFDILLTADGGMLLTGLTRSLGAGGSDIYLVRTDSQGQTVWSQVYGSQLDEEGYATLELADGGYLVLGALLHAGWDYLSMDPDILLTRVDEQGNELWSRVLEESGVQSAFQMVSLGENEFLIAGLQSDSGSPSDTNPLLRRIDAEGNVIWDWVPANENTFDYASDVLVNEAGYLVTGLWSQSAEGGVLWMEVDGKGQNLWQKVLAKEPGDRAGLRILQAADGGYLIIGNIKKAGQEWYSLLIKTDEKGVVVE
jgi:hypothetical protein